MSGRKHFWKQKFEEAMMLLLSHRGLGEFYQWRWTISMKLFIFWAVYFTQHIEMVCIAKKVKPVIDWRKKRVHSNQSLAQRRKKWLVDWFQRLPCSWWFRWGGHTSGVPCPCCWPLPCIEKACWSNCKIAAAAWQMPVIAFHKNLSCLLFCF